MRRRDFLTLAGAAVVWPLTARAQQTQPKRGPGGRPWLIAALIFFTKAQSDLEILGPFRMGMAALGYIEGRDYVLEARYVDGDVTRYPPMARELVELAPDLIIAEAGAGAAAAHQLTTAIPIVASGIDRVNLDLLVGKDLGHPIGNVTGLKDVFGELIVKQCELALELVPGASRVGVLLWPEFAEAAAVRELIEQVAAARKFTPVMLDVSRLQDITPAFRALADMRIDVVVVGPSTVFAADRPLTVSGAAAVKLPAVYNQPAYVEAGGLISYSGTTRRASSARLASFANQILQGAKPSELPVEQPSDYNMAINLKTAKALGLTIPPTVLFRADIVLD
jgi:putative ABC transport system substrate-binding protein